MPRRRGRVHCRSGLAALARAAVARRVHPPHSRGPHDRSACPTCAASTARRCSSSSRKRSTASRRRSRKARAPSSRRCANIRLGMDSRFIDWKHSARHRKLLCKEFRTERNHQVIMAFDTGHLMLEPVDGIARLDHAINAGLVLGLGVAARRRSRRHLRLRRPRPAIHGSRCAALPASCRLQRATAELDYHHQETNFTLGLAELNARLKRRALVILFTDFVDTITAELLIESMQRVANRHLVVFVTQRGSLLQRAVEATPTRFRRRGAGGDRPRLPARAQHRVRAAGAARHPLPRRAEPRTCRLRLINRYLLIKRARADMMPAAI